MIELAKPAIDVGLYTDRLQPMLDFWQQTAGVTFAELLPLGGGLRQHRHAIGDSVLKINHSRDPLTAAPPAGIRRLVIARPEIAEAADLTDPDGNALRLVAPGTSGIQQLQVELTVSRLAEHLDFYGNALGFPQIDQHTFACGASRIRLQQGTATHDPQRSAPGYRYLTIQVYDVRACHAEILRKGGREGMAPVKLGDVAHISFVRDPDGNWIEVSQRKSITGSLD